MASTDPALSPPPALEAAGRLASELVAACARAVRAPREVLEACVACLISGGHLMIEDAPGVGKTVLAKALARASGCSYARVQCTADLLPADVTGVTVWHQGDGTFRFHPGPVFANMVLVDEINRASPKTQSALLECMEERHVTVDGTTRPVPEPFMVIATQNPVEYEGTFPLPEAQLDRFALRVTLGYPSAADEASMILELSTHDALDEVPVVADERTLMRCTWTRRWPTTWWAWCGRRAATRAPTWAPAPAPACRCCAWRVPGRSCRAGRTPCPRT